MRLTHTTAVTAATTLAAVLLLTACGSKNDDATTGTDPGAQPSTAPSATPSATPSTASGEPSASPTVGTYPDFAPEDYTYLLAVSCFCPDAGTPVRVTVVDDEVTRAVYARDGRGVSEGQPAPGQRWVTLDEVIEAANDADAARVDVEWPAGQDYPSSVSVDRDTRMVDEEVGYLVSDVVVG